MTAPVKLKARGTVLTIDGVAVPALESIEISGRKNETYESTTLDGPVIKTKDASGNVEPVTIKASGFHDPTFAASIYTLIETPDITVSTVTFSNSASQTHNIIGYGLDVKAEAGKGVMADYTLEETGVYS